VIGINRFAGIDGVRNREELLIGCLRLRDCVLDIDDG
jgi:hypothetical protein